MSTVHGHEWRGRGGSRQAPRLFLFARQPACPPVLTSVRPSSCSGGQRANLACCLRPPPAMLVRACDAVAMRAASAVHAFKPGSRAESIRPSIDG